VELVLVPIAVALIGGPVMWFLSRFDKRNTEQHGQSIKLLTEVRDDMKTVRRRLDKHIDWHAHQPED
jgi:hypothetical protein